MESSELLHTGIDSPDPSFTTISDVGDLSRAFILQLQQRNDNSANNICETGERVWLSDTNRVSFKHEFGQDACTFDSDMEEVVWILSNTNTATGKRMIVDHQQPLDQQDETGSQEENWNRSISLSYGEDEASIFGFTSNSDGTGTSHPRGTIVASITNPMRVDFWQSDSGEDQGYAYSIVSEWPRSRVLSVTFGESLSLEDNTNLNLKLSLTESLSLDDGIIEN